MSDIQWVFRSAALDADAGVRHAFFTRLGGVSEGLFASARAIRRTGSLATEPSRWIASIWLLIV